MTTATDQDRAQRVRSALDKVRPGASSPNLEQMTAAERARWWAGLTTGERTAVVQELPEIIGAGQGLPASVRDRANRIALDRDLDQMRAVVDLGDRSDDTQKTLRNAQSVRTGLAKAQQTAPGAVIQLYAYDPHAFGGDGKVVVAVGDLDTARNVAWLVPGVGADISRTAGDVQNAADLYKQAGGDRGDVATAIWIGYDAPSGADLGALTGSGAARDGGRMLADDIAGFVTARDQLGVGQGSGVDDRLNLGLIGHSYGSTTVGWAGDNERMSDDLDTVTLLGSPGAGGIATADEFGIGATNVYVGAASDDAVAHLGGATANTGISGLGIDPATTAFGAERFRAEGGDVAPILGNHSSYFQIGSESLENLGRIVAGRGGDITHENRRSTADVIAGQLSGGRRDPAVDSRKAG
ncbi:alpha/beta hydrolase [Gordonia mangrovi]|nr:alpha/beta hydrolase [Gordonia mangrovi]UVF79693.1 alpha/beta hydrolase family protein [Gordonia mangrovi]